MALCLYRLKIRLLRVFFFYFSILLAADFSMLNV